MMQGNWFIMAFLGENLLYDYLLLSSECACLFFFFSSFNYCSGEKEAHRRLAAGTSCMQRLARQCCRYWFHS